MHPPLLSLNTVQTGQDNPQLLPITEDDIPPLHLSPAEEKFEYWRRRVGLARRMALWLLAPAAWRYLRSRYPSVQRHRRCQSRLQLVVTRARHPDPPRDEPRLGLFRGIDKNPFRLRAFGGKVQEKVTTVHPLYITDVGMIVLYASSEPTHSPGARANTGTDKFHRDGAL